MLAWEKLINYFEKELGKQVVNQWLRTLKVVKFDARNIYLEAKDHFHALWFEEHVRKKAKNLLLNNNHHPINIHLRVSNSPQPLNPSKKKKSVAIANSPKSYQILFDELNPLFTFDSFKANPSNLVPYTLLQERADSKADREFFNPIYLYGPSGIGKTHLLIATARALKSKLNVIYVRSETFTEHVVNAIRAGEMSAFRQTYRNASLLIIDDVHLFSRKGATQEELFHTFNTLHLANKQIILSANCPPAELEHIEPRLVSRFEWGITLPLKHYSTVEIEQILDSKMQTLQFPLNKKVSQYLIDQFAANPKSLVQALEALILRTHLSNVEPNRSSTLISVTQTKHTIKDLIEKQEQAEINPKKILEIVGAHFQVSSEQITSKSHKKECVIPRQVAMYLCRKKLNTPYMKIGSLFGRDHSTVISSVRRIQKEIDSGNKEITGPVNTLERQIHL